MANRSSAKKNLRQNVKHRSVNRWRKRRVHDAVIDFEKTLHGNSYDEARDAYVKVTSILDKIAGKHTIHRNTAARRKSRLAKRLNVFKAAQTSA